MKKFLILLILLLLVITAGLYFWSLGDSPKENTVTTQEIQASSTIETNQNEGLTENTDSTDETTTETREVITVDENVLSEDQRNLLQNFGIDTDSIEITADMIQCAEEKIGKERLEAIIQGDLPTFFEGLSLAGCYQ